MAEDEGRDEEEDRSLMDHVRDRLPEAGVGFFGTFVLAMVIGLLLASAGQLTMAAIVFLVAAISIVSMLLTPSPAAKARRAARESPHDYKGEVEDEVEEKGDEEGRLDLFVDDAPALTRARGVPAPPLEPPPLEDIVVDMLPEVDDELKAGVADDDIVVDVGSGSSSDA